MNGDSTDAKAALISSLQTKGTDSKKYTMVLMGLGSLILVFILSLIAMLKKPELASGISTILPPLFLAIGGMISIYAGSQAFVEHGIGSNLTSTPKQ